MIIVNVSLIRRVASVKRDGVNDQHVREAKGEGRVVYGRAQTADQVRGSLACSVHKGTVRFGFRHVLL
jgi:hypothetical protein